MLLFYFRKSPHLVIMVGSSREDLFDGERGKKKNKTRLSAREAGDRFVSFK